MKNISEFGSRNLKWKLLLLVMILNLVYPQVRSQQFTIDQTLSDEAQRTTIAFDGLAFVTGCLGADSFFPPGKVADFWGFQYLRDNDATHMGHNTDFLTKAAFNLLYVLTPEQRQQLIVLAESQVEMINQYGYNRFVLMKAFRRLLEGDLPPGTNGLGEEAVKAYSAQLYALDGTISYMRAKVMGSMIYAFTPSQKSYLDGLKGIGMLNWPNVPEPPELQGLEHDVKVAVMTYAGDMFSWYVGSVEADVYFCPERQGTYFGSFYMKDAPAVGNPNYTIDTNLTAVYGNAFVNELSPSDSALISGVVSTQKPYLLDIVQKREDVSVELRKFISGQTADSLSVMQMMENYGELDGEIVYLLANAFASVNSRLTGVQIDSLMALREGLLGDLSVPSGAYLYAEPIPVPEIPNTDFLFSNTTTYTASYPVVSTDVEVCYNNTTTITCPTDPAAAFYGQFPGVNLPSYQNNGNETITDLVTGLTWQRSPDANGDNDGIIEKSDKLSLTQIEARVAVLNSTNWGGYNDWRIPTIKELYSLTNWNGTDPSGYNNNNTAPLTPFIDNTVFQFAWGQTSAGERLIDSQYASSNIYNEKSFAGFNMLFGFNFADGRIKGYDLVMPGGVVKYFSFIAVRGNTTYSDNQFVDNGNQTITDQATGLMWSKDDSQVPMNWQQALAWAQAKNAENWCGHNDWRLPNAKELHTIVDYTRSPSSTHSAAIDPVFNCTSVTNEAGRTDWPWFWTSTTHKSYNGVAYKGDWAVYVCFGRAAGWAKIGNNTYYSYRDVHGAGAQRSSPKSGTFAGQYLGVDSLGNAVYGLGPQGDIIRINNFVRLVRDAETTPPNHTQTLEIPSGWSGISLGVVPDNPMTETMFSDFTSSGNLVILQNYTSNYWPQAGINTIDLAGGWNNFSGYKVKINQGQNLVVSGQPLSDKTLDIPQAGWYLLPVLNECGVSVSNIFEGITSHLVVIKEIAGTGIYWPGYAQTLFTLEAGKAYSAKFSDAVSLEFPECTSTSDGGEPVLKTVLPVHFSSVAPSPGSHLIMFTPECLSALPEEAEFAAFTPEGKCAGAVAVISDRQNAVLTLFPDDPTTPVKDGFVSGESLLLKVFLPDIEQEFTLDNVTYDSGMPDNSGTFHPDGLSVVTGFKQTAVQENEVKAVIFPNPTTGIFSVEGLPAKAVNISISDIYGRIITRTTANPVSGTVKIDITGQKPGIYLILAETEYERKIARLLLE